MGYRRSARGFGHHKINIPIHPFNFMPPEPRTQTPNPPTAPTGDEQFSQSPQNAGSAERPYYDPAQMGGYTAPPRSPMTTGISQPYYSPVKPLEVQNNGEWMLLTGFASMIALVFLTVRFAFPMWAKSQSVAAAAQSRQTDLQSDLLRQLVESSSATQKGFLKEMLGDWKAERIADREVFDKILGMTIETQQQAVSMQGETRKSIQALRELFEQINATETTRAEAMQALIRAFDDLSRKVDELHPIALAESVQRTNPASSRAGAFQE